MKCPGGYAVDHVQKTVHLRNTTHHYGQTNAGNTATKHGYESHIEPNSKPRDNIVDDCAAHLSPTSDEVSLLQAPTASPHAFVPYLAAGPLQKCRRWYTSSFHLARPAVSLIPHLLHHRAARRRCASAPSSPMDESRARKDERRTGRKHYIADVPGTQSQNIRSCDLHRLASDFGTKPDIARISVAQVYIQRDPLLRRSQNSDHEHAATPVCGGRTCSARLRPRYTRRCHGGERSHRDHVPTQPKLHNNTVVCGLFIESHRKLEPRQPSQHFCTPAEPP